MWGDYGLSFIAVRRGGASGAGDGPAAGTPTAPRLHGARPKRA